MYDQIFSVDDRTFNSVALEIFRRQYEQVTVYQTFCNALGKSPSTVTRSESIPFLPVEFFKNHQIIGTNKQPQRIFESSGTTDAITSKHYVADIALYEKSILKGFQLAYGNPADYVFLALLPSYLERSNSSLVFMAKILMQASGKSENGFYLNEFEKLRDVLQELKGKKQKTILLGVTFGLLDFAENHSVPFPELIVMETGGMKGRREELTRQEVHEILRNAFQVRNIHSEYGMTELLSQAYSKGDGVFSCPPWMKIFVRDMYDPFQSVGAGNAGGLNIIDLANINSCSFIATGDVGKVNSDGSFEVLGRLDQAEVRGCNLMIA